MKSISIDQLETILKNNGVVFDTRSEVLFNHDALKGVKHLPLELVQAGTLPDVAKDCAVYLICEYGHISELVGLYLESAGFKDVSNVEGGMKAWRLKHKHFKLF